MLRKEHMDKLYRKALALEYFTVGYNILEAIFSIFFGSVAGSIALVGFGLDSIVESLSGFVLIWRLRKHGAASEVPAPYQKENYKQANECNKPDYFAPAIDR
jgi:hypothetical protein